MDIVTPHLFHVQWRYTGIDWYCIDNQPKEHIKTYISRMNKDETDSAHIGEYLNDREPFADEEELKSISSGVVFDKDVNAYDAKAVGEKIILKESLSINMYSREKIRLS